MLRLARLMLLVPPVLFLALALFGCATTGPAASATAIPYDPNLLTVPRKEEADRWAADVTRMQLVAPYMNAICASDGPWAKARDAWAEQQKAVWRDVIWHFQPIPNAPASSGGGTDIGAMIGSILGGVIKGALFMPAQKGVVPPGLPPC